MANSSKDKGDRFERAALRHVMTEYGHLVDVTEPGRNRAGKAQDPGDIHLFTDAAVQVKAYGRAAAGAARALRAAAEGAATQAASAGLPRHLGMVPVIGARTSTVHWLAAVLEWPVPLGSDAHPTFGMPDRAVDHVRNDAIGIPRERRVALVVRSGKADLWVATLPAWFAVYATTRPVVERDAQGQRVWTAEQVAALLAG